MRSRWIACLIASVLLGGAPAWAATYTIDKEHSSVSFKIRHLLSKVEGLFRDFSGTVEYEPGQSEAWKADATIQAGSIDTRVEGRDNHLRGPEFFDVGQYPTITFNSTHVTDVSGNSAKLHGVLAIHGVEKPVVLDVKIHGVAKDPWGNVRAGFTGTTTVNRKDFGLTWNKALETGELLVGDDVEITLEVEGIKQ